MKPHENDVQYYERRAMEFDAIARTASTPTVRTLAQGRAEWCRDQAERERELVRQIERLVQGRRNHVQNS